MSGTVASPYKYSMIVIKYIIFTALVLLAIQKFMSTDMKEHMKEIQLLTKSNLVIRSKNQRLEMRIDEHEQYQRVNYLEIKGVPVQGDHHLFLAELVRSPVS